MRVFFGVVMIKIDWKSFCGTLGLLGVMGLVQAAPVQSTTTTTSYDGNGNATSVKVVTTVSEPAGSKTYTRLTLNTYGSINTSSLNAAGGPWQLGLLTCSELATQIPADANLVAQDLVSVRSVSYTYDFTDAALYGYLHVENTGATNTTAMPAATDSCAAPDANTTLTKTYAYDGFGNLSQTTLSGPSGNFTSRTNAVTFDSNGIFPISNTNAMGQSETKVFDSVTGKIKSSTGPNGLTTTWSYDELGRTTAEIHPDGTVFASSYASCDTSCQGNEQFKLTNSLLNAVGGSAVSAPTTAYYDVLGRSVRSLTTGYDGRSLVSTKVFNALGQTVEVDEPYLSPLQGTEQIRASLTSYDWLGRVTQTTEPGGRISKIQYVSSFEKHFINPANQTKVEKKNGLARLVEVDDYAGQKLQYVYDVGGNLRKTIDPKGNVIEMQYDLLGHKVKLIDPDMGTWSYNYDLLGQLSTQTDAKGQQTTNYYDLLGRLTNRVDAGDLNSFWEYDTAPKGVGKLAHVYTKLGDGTIDYERWQTYDNLGRSNQVITTKRIDPQAQAKDPNFIYTVSYDTVGRVSSVTYPTGIGYKNIYDSNGYLQKVVNKDSGALYWQALTRDAAGHVTSEQLGNGLVTNRAYAQDTGDLATIATGVQSGSTFTASVQNDAYGFDALGNLKIRSQYFGSNSLTENFTYDGMNRLATAALTNGAQNGSLVSATYDVLGNVLSRSDVGAYTYGASGVVGCSGPHQVCSITGMANTTFSYDANGNMLSGNNRTYTWTSYNMPSSIAQGTVTDSFIYNADHERVRQVSTDSASGQTSTTVYLNPRIDLGGTFEKDYKANGSVQFVHHIYAGGHVIGNLVLTSGSTLIDSAPAWTSAVSQGSSGLSTNTSNASGIYLNTDPYQQFAWDTTSQPCVSGGCIDITRKPAAAVSYPSLVGTTSYGNQGVRFHYEFATGTGSSNVWMLAGPQGSGGLYHFLKVVNGGASVQYIDGSNGSNFVTQSLNFPIQDNSAYVVEVETTPTTSSLYIYPKSGSRAQGVSHVLNLNWLGASGTDTRKLVIYGYTPGNSGPTATAYLTNISTANYTVPQPNYFHTDHLGSITATSDSAGNVASSNRFSYDAWGKRRNTDGSDNLVVNGLVSTTPLWTMVTGQPLPPQPTTSTSDPSGIYVGGDPYNQFVWDTSKSVCANACLTIITKPNGSASAAYPALYGTAAYSSQNVRFHYEFTAGHTNPGGSSWLLAGPQNTGSQASGKARYQLLKISGGRASVQYIDGKTVGSDGVTVNFVTQDLNFSVEDGKSYTVEFDTTPNSSVLYIYPSIGTRAQGVSHSVYLDWTAGSGLSRKIGIYGYSNAGSTGATNYMYLTNVSASSYVYGANIVAQSTDHGFTQHEMLDSIGLINMNGRVYDPIVGRFVSADSNIDGVTDTQGYNRYSYVLNNPLSLTDPSGYSWWGKHRKQLAAAAAIVLPNVFGPVYYPKQYEQAMTVAAIVGATVLTGGAAAGALGLAPGSLEYGMVYGAASGFTGSSLNALASGADFETAFWAGFQGGIVGGISGGISTGIGDSINQTTSPFANALAHGIAEGAINETQGTGFRSGFLGGFASAYGANVGLSRSVGGAFLVGAAGSYLGGGDAFKGGMAAVIAFETNCIAHGCDTKLSPNKVNPNEGSFKTTGDSSSFPPVPAPNLEEGLRALDFFLPDLFTATGSMGISSDSLSVDKFGQIYVTPAGQTPSFGGSGMAWWFLSPDQTYSASAMISAATGWAASAVYCDVICGGVMLGIDTKLPFPWVNWHSTAIGIGGGAAEGVSAGYTMKVR